MIYFQRTSAPAPPAVERTTGGGAVETAAASPTRPDPFAGDNHNGSANLFEFPPTNAEYEYASRLFHAPDDLKAARALRDLTGSPARSAAILRVVRREAMAQGVISRVQGGAT